MNNFGSSGSNINQHVQCLCDVTQDTDENLGAKFGACTLKISGCTNRRDFGLLRLLLVTQLK